MSITRVWYQISYPPGTDGHGYVTTSDKYIRAMGDMRKLPYVDIQGVPLPTP